MSGSGKGGNNRKNRQHFSGRREDFHRNDHRQHESSLSENKFERNRNAQERPHWTAPEVSNAPSVIYECPWCGKPINDISSALSDKNTGKPVHFECVLSRITEMENLETHDSVCYIGGGRFGIVHYNNPPDIKNFTIKKVLEWENKDSHFDWRQSISEQFPLS